MSVKKLSGSEKPKLVEVLSVQKSQYRTGRRFELLVRCTWGHKDIMEGFTWYQEDVTVEYDYNPEDPQPAAPLIKAAYQKLKEQDTTEADLVFKLENMSIEP